MAVTAPTVPVALVGGCHGLRCDSAGCMDGHFFYSIRAESCQNGLLGRLLEDTGQKCHHREITQCQKWIQILKTIQISASSMVFTRKCVCQKHNTPMVFCE